ncbi:MAG TPA: hypothetical protein VK158_01625 [Acidobacteriota bacterium]|nr:hypothetical protein [Acidobacteriota bacterium]
MQTTPISKESIITGLANLYDKNVPLRADAISQADPHLWYCLYDKTQSGGRKYESLKDARSDLAQYFAQLGRDKDSRKVLTYNWKQPSPTRLSTAQRNAKKRELLATLKQKLNAEEDLRYRAQQQTDRKFASAGYRYFNGWDSFLNAAGIDPLYFARQVKYPLQMYLCALYDWYLQGNPMDMTTVSDTLPDIVAALSQRCNGYYSALSKMEKLLLKCNLPDDAQECAPQQWMNSLKKQVGIENKVRKEELRQTMISMKLDEAYPVHYVHRLGIGHTTDFIRGRDVRDFLIHSKRWTTPAKLARDMKVSEVTLLRKLPFIAEDVVKIQEKNRPRYFVLKTAAQKLQIRTRQEQPYTSLTDIAMECEVDYCVVRRHRDQLQLGRKTKTGRKHYVLSKDDVLTLKKSVIDEKQRGIENVKKWIQVLGTQPRWTPKELVRAQIPASHFYQEAARRRIPASSYAIPAVTLISYFSRVSKINAA